MSFFAEANHFEISGGTFIAQYIVAPDTYFHNPNRIQDGEKPVIGNAASSLQRIPVSPHPVEKMWVYRVTSKEDGGTPAIHVSSDIEPSQWDPRFMNTLRSSIFPPDGTAKDLSITLVEDEVSHQTDDGGTWDKNRPAIDFYYVRQRAPCSTEDTSIHFPVQLSSPRVGPENQEAERHQIHFFDEDRAHSGFNNCSPHDVRYMSKRYPTSEHLFQSLKFAEQYPHVAEHIRTFSESGSTARAEARKFEKMTHPEWDKVRVRKMDDVLYLKFTQHPDLRRELMLTGDSELLNVSGHQFWGVSRHSMKGRNELGKCLERLRTKFQQGQ